MRHLLSKERWILILRLGTTAVFLLPLFWMLLTALHPPGTPLPQSLNLWPNTPTLNNFIRIWQIIPIGRFTLNSLLVSTIAIPLTLLISSWAGFSIAHLPPTSQRRWVLLSLALLMIPGIALWFTRFLLYRQLHWLNTYWALIVPAWMGTTPFYVLMFYRAFRRIPSAIYDAARLETSHAFQIWAYIAFPLARPTALGVSLLSLTFYWGDFLSPLLYLRTESLYTLPIAIQLLQQMAPSDWPLLMATAVYTSLIPVTLFLLTQPHFAHLNRRNP
ncbi:MAG: carbohydrate ABC transporter permease [Chloroflexi bacterium]|nr:MAG: carbohydrate ABC transporter permease [Chloroflexota bacterium]